jgi:hypothetical protein
MKVPFGAITTWHLPEPDDEYPVSGTGGTLRRQNSTPRQTLWSFTFQAEQPNPQKPEAWVAIDLWEGAGSIHYQVDMKTHTIIKRDDTYGMLSAFRQLPENTFDGDVLTIVEKLKELPVDQRKAQRYEEKSFWFEFWSEVWALLNPWSNRPQ